MRKIKFRERLHDQGHGEYWDTMYYGTFQGWGIKNGTTVAIVEIDYFVKMTSRKYDAQEDGTKFFDLKGLLRLAKVEYDFIRFLD